MPLSPALGLQNMDKYQPILTKTKISGFLFFFIGSLFLLFLAVSSIYYGEWGYYGTAILGILGIVCFVFSFLILKAKNQLTPEAAEQVKKQHKKWEEEFYSRWYVRYLGAVFMLGWAYVCYIIYTKGMTLPGLSILLLNPITGIVVTIIAIFNAWEISLIVIAGVVLYYTYLGIAALPVSVATAVP